MQGAPEEFYLFTSLLNRSTFQARIAHPPRTPRL